MLFHQNDTPSIAWKQEFLARNFWDPELEDGADDSELEDQDVLSEWREELRTEGLEAEPAGRTEERPQSLDHAGIAWLVRRRDESFRGTNEGEWLQAFEELKEMASELKEEARRSVGAGRAGSGYWTALKRFLLGHDVVFAWWLFMKFIQGTDLYTDPEAWGRKSEVLNWLWRGTEEHRLFEQTFDKPRLKKLESSPEYREKRRTADKARDRVRKNTPEAKEKQREVQRAYRERLKKRDLPLVKEAA